MKKTMMYLPEELHRYLALESEARGVSMAEIAREAIAEYRVRHVETKTRGVQAIFGIIEDDGLPFDVLTDVDEAMKEYYKVGGQWDQENLGAGSR